MRALSPIAGTFVVFATIFCMLSVDVDAAGKDILCSSQKSRIHALTHNNVIFYIHVMATLQNSRKSDIHAALLLLCSEIQDNLRLGFRDIGEEALLGFCRR